MSIIIIGGGGGGASSASVSNWRAEGRPTHPPVSGGRAPLWEFNFQLSWLQLTLALFAQTARACWPENGEIGAN